MAKRETKEVYLCRTDWAYEVGHNWDGNLVFPSLNALVEHYGCVEDNGDNTNGCGWVRVRMTLLEIGGESEPFSPREPRSGAI